MGRKTTMMKETTWLAVTMAAIGGLSFVMLPEPVQADDSMVASMHPVDPAAKRVSERTVGTVTFAPGKAAGETSMAVRLEDLPMSGQEPLMVQGEHAIFRHGLQILATGDCSSPTLGGAGAINLPTVDLRNTGNADMTTTVKGVTLSALAGKSVALFIGTDPSKGRVVACGVFKKGAS